MLSARSTRLVVRVAELSEQSDGASDEVSENDSSSQAEGSGSSLITTSGSTNILSVAILAEPSGEGYKPSLEMDE